MIGEMLCTFPDNSMTGETLIISFIWNKWENHIYNIYYRKLLSEIVLHNLGWIFKPSSDNFHTGKFLVPVKIIGL